MDHHPSWKLHKNPFWRVKHPSLKKAVVAPDDAVARNSASGTMSTVTAGINTAPHLTSTSMGVTMEDQMYVYEASEPVQGVCILSLQSGKKMDHLGIKIQFIGRIDMVCIWMGGNYVFSQQSSHVPTVPRATAFTKVVRITISFPWPRNSRLRAPCSTPGRKFHSCSRIWTRNLKATVVAMCLWGTLLRWKLP